MTRTTVALLALWMLPTGAFAQGDFGLDLNQPDEQSESQQDQQEGNEGGEESAPSSSEPIGATPVTPPPPTEPRKDPNPQAGERNIIQDDRVKSVQRKVYLKKGRFELEPAFGFSVNDPYNQKWGLTGRLAYYLADTLAISARGGVLSLVKTDDAFTATRTFQSIIRRSKPEWTAMGNVEWSPIYGKFSIWNSILHFDGYVLGGAGVVYTETSARPEVGPHIGFDLGGGVRFVAKDFIAVNAALINTSYVDQPVGTSNGSVQNLLMLYTGISIFLPFKSTGRESE